MASSATRIKTWLTHPLVLLAVCVGFLAVLWRHMGPVAVAIASPLVGAVLARPLINLVADLRHRVREQVWLPVHGQHYVFKDITIRVVEDDLGHRWISLVDVRKAAPVTVTDATLRSLYRDRFRVMGEPPGAFLQADALVEALARSIDLPLVRLRSWVETTVAAPARKQRRFIAATEPAPPRF